MYFSSPAHPPEAAQIRERDHQRESLLVNYLSDPPACASSAQGTQLSDGGCNFLRPTLRDPRAASRNRGSLKILPSFAGVGWGTVINFWEGVERTTTLFSPPRCWGTRGGASPCPLIYLSLYLQSPRKRPRAAEGSESKGCPGSHTPTGSADF